MRILLVMGLCLVAGIAIAGCTQQATPVQTTTTTAAPAAITAPVPAETTASAGMPNPASVNCVNIGGTVGIRTDASGGQYGMCTFANGTSCEEWALYRGEGCTSGMAAATTTAAAT